MSLATGARLGPVEILSPLGTGGTDEVYRARDRKLDRDVAIKIFPEAVADDSERVARYVREARTLAAVNCVNIAHIDGLEKWNGVRALAMELVEGPTFVERIARGPIPTDESLAIAGRSPFSEPNPTGISSRTPCRIRSRSCTWRVDDISTARFLITEPISSASARRCETAAACRKCRRRRIRSPPVTGRMHSSLAPCSQA